MLESRYTFGGAPARGISVFAANDELGAQEILATKLRTYPRYRQVSGSALAALTVLLPTFQVPHWTVLLRPPTASERAEPDLVADLLDILGSVLDNPKYEPTRSKRK